MRLVLLLALLSACKAHEPAAVELPVNDVATLDEWTSIVRGMRIDAIDDDGHVERERAPVLDYKTTTGPTVIQLWASYCPPCLEEMPMFDELFDAGYNVIGVSLDSQNLDDVRKVLDQLSPAYPQGVLQLWSMKKVGRFLESGLPFTIVLDARGRARYIFKGQTSKAAIVGALEHVRS